MVKFLKTPSNRCYYKFPDIRKKISVLEAPLQGITGLMARNVIKKETTA